ncbi:MAG: acyltransferase family protein [Candidatus Cryptobacteroides sp.]
MCHAAPNGVNLPPLLKTVFGLGQLGVDIFFFLSGFGLFYSLSKPHKSICEWYHKRFLRIVVPYLIIYAPALLLICIQNEKPWWYYFYNLSTLSFWFNDGGCWFISVLVPLYLVAPLWKKMLDRSNKAIVPTLFICAALFTLGYVMIPYLSSFLNQCLFFFIGMWLGKCVLGGVMYCILNRYCHTEYYSLSFY